MKTVSKLQNVIIPVNDFKLLSDSRLVTFQKWDVNKSITFSIFWNRTIGVYKLWKSDLIHESIKFER